MKEKIKAHIGYYASLVVIFVFGYVLVILAFPNRELQILVAAITTFLYVFWGIVHHVINHDLHLKIVVEYILIGILGFTMIIFIL